MAQEHIRPAEVALCVLRAVPLVPGRYAGNVATQADRVSIAVVTVAAPTSEPWLTLHYDEWICILEGRMVLQSARQGTVLRREANLSP